MGGKHRHSETERQRDSEGNGDRELRQQRGTSKQASRTVSTGIGGREVGASGFWVGCHQYTYVCKDTHKHI